MTGIRAWWAVSAVLVIAALAVVPSGSLASPPVSGSGSYTVTGFVPTGVRSAGDKTILSGTETVEFTGTISGTGVHDLVLTIQPDGSFTVRGKGTFSGTVDGISGGFEDAIKGSGVLGVSVQGTFTITDGSGGLADLSGHAAFAGIPLKAGTYTVQFHLEG